MSPGWDWFIFQQSTPITAWDWSSTEEVLGEEYAGGLWEVSFVPTRRKVIATEIIGQLVILRRKPKIKVIKRNTKMTDVKDIEYEYNDSYQLTLSIEGDDRRVKEKIHKLNNCAISAQLGTKGAMCTLVCVPLNSDDDISGKFELTARIMRVKMIRKNTERDSTRRTRGS